MGNKVYILFRESGEWDFFSSEIHGVYNSLISAEKEKPKLEDKKTVLEKEYFDKYGSTLNEDFEGDFLDDDIIKRYYTFLRENPELEIETLRIQEFIIQ